MQFLSRFVAVLAVALFTSLGATHALAQGTVFNQSGGTAIKGYDPVAYFTQSDAVKGAEEHSHMWQGVKWLFATAANRDAFAAEPEKFAPQYGGYCSYAMSRDYVADITPTAWKVVDGKLYLNNSRAVHLWWQADIPSNISKADANWPGQKEKLAQ